MFVYKEAQQEEKEPRDLTLLSNEEALAWAYLQDQSYIPED